MGISQRRLSDSFWDLRDDAHDHPARWQGLNAEAVFQRLAECVEAAEEKEQPVDWQRDVTEPLVAWRVNETDEG